jgi:hypothetical protein
MKYGLVKEHKGRVPTGYREPGKPFWQKSGKKGWNIPSKSGKSQGILCLVREIWDFEKSQGNSGKSLESQGNLTFSCHTRKSMMPQTRLYYD